MSNLKNVLRVELVRETNEKVIKTKRHDYARGGFSITETIVRETVERPVAFLDCGHQRKEHDYGTVISKASKLSCHVCERIEWEKKHGRAA